MNGLVYVIEKLGQALAEAEADNARLRQENQALRERSAPGPAGPTKET